MIAPTPQWLAPFINPVLMLLLILLAGKPTWFPAFYQERL